MGNQWGKFTFASPNQNVGGTCPPVPLIIAAPGCRHVTTIDVHVVHGEIFRVQSFAQSTSGKCRCFVWIRVG